MVQLYVIIRASRGNHQRRKTKQLANTYSTYLNLSQWSRDPLNLHTTEWAVLAEPGDERNVVSATVGITHIHTDSHTHSHTNTHTHTHTHTHIHARTPSLTHSLSLRW